MYQPRHYRNWVSHHDLVSFSVVVKETDLFIRARSDLSQIALKLVRECRAILEDYIREHPKFAFSLEPVAVEEDAPSLVREMGAAAEAAGVGPMAAVAGAIAEEVGRGLLDFSEEVIVENGGDIFIKSSSRRLVGIYAGESPLSGRIALEIEPDDTPLGVCTSSGTVGHSLSLGLADAVVVLSPSTALADAAATAIANLVSFPEDIDRALERAQGIKGLSGIAVVKDDKLGLWGKLKVVRLQR